MYGPVRYQQLNPIQHRNNLAKQNCEDNNILQFLVARSIAAGNEIRAVIGNVTEHFELSRICTFNICESLPSIQQREEFVLSNFDDVHFRGCSVADAVRKHGGWATSDLKSITRVAFEP